MSDTLNPAPDGQDNGNNSTPYQKFLEQIKDWKGPELLLDVQMFLFPDLLATLQAGELSQTELGNLWGVLSRNRVGRRDDLTADFEKYAATHTPDPAQAVQQEMNEEEKQAALELLRRPDLVYRAVQTIGALGVEGETKNRALLFLAVVSRLTEEIISILVKGLSSGGKSNLVKRTLALFPVNAYYEFTAMSTKALIYADLTLSNRFLVIYEEDGNEEAQYIVRTLLSEGKLSYLTTVKNPATGKFEAMTIERPGPTGLITTMTRSEGRVDNETRAWSLFVDDSEKQTFRVIGAMAKGATGNGSKPDVTVWQNAMSLLEPLEVRIPFAEVLARLLEQNKDRLPKDSTRLRRDFARLLSLVKVVALVHQHSRSRRDGLLEATPADYAVALSLVGITFAQGVRRLSPKALELIEAVTDLYEKKSSSEMQAVTISEIIRRTGASKATVHRWIDTAEESGYLERLDVRGARGAELYKPGKKPDAADLLPSTRELIDTWQQVGEWVAVNPLTGEIEHYTFSISPETLRHNPLEAVPDDEKTVSPPFETVRDTETLNPEAVSDRLSVSMRLTGLETVDSSAQTVEDPQRLSVSPETEEVFEDWGDEAES